MSVYWPDHANETFGAKILSASHSLDESELFQDDGLAYLLDAYPRETLDIWTFGPHREGQSPALRGQAPTMSGKEILDAVKNGRIWLNLRRANLEVPEIKPIANEIFGSLENAIGQKTNNQDIGLLISSPKVHVHYHLDIPMVALFQLRGRKRVWLYPNDETCAPSDRIEQIVHMKREEDLPYRHDFDDKAEVFDLEPGMGITWPQLAPHRVQNENCMNVSLSCEYMTLKSAINANAIYTNSFLREKMNLNPRHSAGFNARELGKAAFARVHKRLSKQGPRKSPTPITFELDTSVETCVRSLSA